MSVAVALGQHAWLILKHHTNEHGALSGNRLVSIDLTATLNQYCLNSSGVCSSCTKAADMFVADIATKHSLNQVARAEQAYILHWHRSNRCCIVLVGMSDGKASVEYPFSSVIEEPRGMSD